MPRKNKAVVKYEAYASLMDLEAVHGPDIFKKLKRLSYGNGGCMWPTIQPHTQGYAVDREEYVQDDNSWYGEYVMFTEIRESYLDHKYNVVIAFHDGKPVGWTVTDFENMFNIYVAKRWRKTGISDMLTKQWVQMSLAQRGIVKRRKVPQALYITHTSTAAKLMNRAYEALGLRRKKMVKKKLKVVHRPVKF